MTRDLELLSRLMSGSASEKMLGTASTAGTSTKLESESDVSVKGGIGDRGGSGVFVDLNHPPASLEIVWRVVVAFKKKVEVTTL